MERFPFFHEREHTVHRDGHIQVDGGYYSAPPEYRGRDVWVRWDSRLVRIFNQQLEEIAIGYGAYRLKNIRQLIQHKAAKQEQMEFMQEHPIIRSMDVYGDRFLHHAEVINITGKSYRMRDRDRPQPTPQDNKKRRDRPRSEEPDAA